MPLEQEFVVVESGVADMELLARTWERMKVSTAPVKPEL